MIKSVGILGGGHMGADIFGFLSSNLPVTIWVRNEEKRDVLEAKLLGPLRRRAKRAGRRGDEARQRLEGLKITTDLADLAGCDLISESIVEDPDVKRGLFKRLAPHLKPDAIVTSNSSYTMPSVLADAHTYPARFAGLHFFFPSKFVPFVEIIPHIGTDEAVVETLTSFIAGMKRRPILVRKEIPGFLVNRGIGSFYTEALHIAGEGYYSASEIDRLCKEQVSLNGPVESADRIGLDVILMGEIRFPDQKRPGEYIAPILHHHVPLGKLGFKAGHGVFIYEKGVANDDPDLPKIFGPDGDPGQYSERDLMDRIYYAEIQEAYRLLDAGIGSREDIAYCLQEIIGFKEPPMDFTDRIGKAAVVERLNELEEAFGPRFKVYGSLASTP